MRVTAGAALRLAGLAARQAWRRAAARALFSMPWRSNLSKTLVAKAARSSAALLATSRKRAASRGRRGMSSVRHGAFCQHFAILPPHLALHCPCSHLQYHPFAYHA